MSTGSGPAGRARPAAALPPDDEVLPTLGAFLRSRRRRLTPAAVGLRTVGRRRAAGLRREEVAQLAGISPTWYMQLEQGRALRPSREVLDALAHALRLDAAERAYLHRLGAAARARGARTAQSGPVAGTGGPAAAVANRGRAERHDRAEEVRGIVDAFERTPAVAIDRHWYVVACNRAFATLMPGFDSYVCAPDAGANAVVGTTPALNLVEYMLTHPAPRVAVRDWAAVARLAVDGLRASLADVAAEPPQRDRASAIVRHLRAVSPEFRAWWPEHGVWNADRSVVHEYDHPELGRLAVNGSTLDVRSSPGLTLLVYVPHDDATRAALIRLAGPAPEQS